MCISIFIYVIAQAETGLEAEVYLKTEVDFKFGLGDLKIVKSGVLISSLSFAIASHGAKNLSGSFKIIQLCRKFFWQVVIL